METHKQRMAHERQMTSERVKGKVPLVVTSLNARSITNKLSSRRHIFYKRKVDVCVVNEMNVPRPSKIGGYTWFHARDDRNCRGTTIYVATRWAKMQKVK